MRRLILVLLLFSPGWAQPEKEARERADAIRANYAKFEYRIPMRDGKRLFTAVYVPNAANLGKSFPLLLFRTPYSVGPYGQDRYAEEIGPTRDFEKDGYVFVQQDVRGRWMSEGEFVNMRPCSQAINESTDAYDTIEWLVHHVPHNNGRVGMWGISYPGFYAAAAAIHSHPALKAVSPQAPIADWWRGDDMHRNGAFNVQLAFTFLSGFGRPRPGLIEEMSESMKYGTVDPYQYFLDLGSLANAAARYGFDNKFWRDMVEHPNYDEFWQSRNLLPHLQGIACAMLVVGGWYDTEDLYGPLHIYQTARQNNATAKTCLMMGPWSHGGWTRTPGRQIGDSEFGFNTSKTYQELALAYFRYHLKGETDPQLPGAMVFETGANRWRSFPAWPPAEAQRRTLYFGSEGSLGWQPSAGVDEFVSDPAKPVPYTQDFTSMRLSKAYMGEDQRFAARRPDVLVYQTPSLEAPLTLAGPLGVNLWVSTTGSDADWVVKLIDVNPGKDGAARSHQQTLVRGEPFRGRFRKDPAHPEGFPPNQVVQVHYQLNDVFHTFQRGHRLMVQVQSSWFPFIDRNPQTFVSNIFEARPGDFRKATHRLHRSAQHPSGLELPVLAAPDE